MLGLIEETLDQIPFFVEMFVIPPLYFPVGFGRNNSNALLLVDKGHNLIGVIALVGQHKLKRQSTQQGDCFRKVAGLTGGQCKTQRIP